MWHKNWDKIQKSSPDKLQVLSANLRIRGHFPAPIIDGGGDSLWKWPIFRLSRARDLDVGSGHTAYRHASLIDLYLHTKFHWNQRNFLWTHGCMDGRTFLYPYMLLSRLRGVDLKKTTDRTTQKDPEIHKQQRVMLNTMAELNQEK